MFISDIQATTFTAATSNVIIAPSVRLKGIIIAPENANSPSFVELKTESASGATLFETAIPAYAMVNMLLPAAGIPFPRGVYVSTLTNVASVTLLTDKYSGPALTPNPA
jgi:hypothetical protein